MNFELVGYLAAVCTTISFLPQAVKIIRSGDTKALSVLMYSFFTLGVFLWMVYGFILGDNAIIIANLITGILAAVILYNKIRNHFFRGIAA